MTLFSVITVCGTRRARRRPRKSALGAEEETWATWHLGGRQLNTIMVSSVGCGLGERETEWFTSGRRTEAALKR